MLDPNQTRKENPFRPPIASSSSSLVVQPQTKTINNKQQNKKRTIDPTRVVDIRRTLYTTSSLKSNVSDTKKRGTFHKSEQDKDKV